MSEWILVRGAKIERSFLKDSIAEARSLVWNPRLPPEEDHSHCIICNVAIPWDIEPGEQVYQSTYGWLCSYCYTHFVSSESDQ